jgi:hypothetical protein
MKCGPKNKTFFCRHDGAFDNNMIKFVGHHNYIMSMLKLKSTLLALVVICVVSHAQERSVTSLEVLYNQYDCEGILPKDASWLPYPAYSDRDSWTEILGSQAEYLIGFGEKYLDYTWQSVDATAYLAYERTGDRQSMEKPLRENRVALNALILAELAEGKGRFLDQLINGTWHTAHMPSWVLSAHLPRQRTRRTLPDPDQQIIDLGSSPFGAQMSAAYHFFHESFDKVDPVISRVIKSAVKKQILDPYLDPSNYKAHWWLGFDQKPGAVVNNWNPWCNAEVILCFLLLEDDYGRLEQAVRQSLKSVDRFIAYIKKDGACEEGPAYWGHAAGKLFDYLQIMHYATAGKMPFFEDALVKDMGEYISRSLVNDGWVVNFADAGARMSFIPSLIYNYGKAVSSEEMRDFAIYNLGRKQEGKFAMPKPIVGNDIFRSLESIRLLDEMSARVEQLNNEIASGRQFAALLDGLRASVPEQTWYPETQFCYLRNESDWFFAAKGGHNNESHNHNDIGTFILYKGAVPVFVDAGVGTYTKTTFDSNRYTIWSMQSNWHNLPLINGKAQKNGAKYKASDIFVNTKGKTASFKLDIAGAYQSDACCNSWVREYRMTDKLLTITDEYELESRNAPDVVNFLVQGEVREVNDNEVVVVNKDVSFRLVYPSQMTLTVEEKELTDPKLTNVWGTMLRRLSFTGPDNAPVKGRYTFRISEL